MHSSTRESVLAAFDALDSAVDTVVGSDFAALTTPELLALLTQLERVRQLLPDLTNRLSPGCP